MLIFYGIAIICLTIIAVLYINYKSYELTIKTYNANAQGWLLTKGDKINRRIEQFSKSVKLHNNLIAQKDFLEFVKAMQIMIAQELTYKKFREEGKNDNFNIQR